MGNQVNGWSGYLNSVPPSSPLNSPGATGMNTDFKPRAALENKGTTCLERAPLVSLRNSERSKA